MSEEALHIDDRDLHFEIDAPRELREKLSTLAEQVHQLGTEVHRVNLSLGKRVTKTDALELLNRKADLSAQEELAKVVKLRYEEEQEYRKQVTEQLKSGQGSVEAKLNEFTHSMQTSMQKLSRRAQTLERLRAEDREFVQSGVPQWIENAVSEVKMAQDKGSAAFNQLVSKVRKQVIKQQETVDSLESEVKKERVHTRARMEEFERNLNKALKHGMGGATGMTPDEMRNFVDDTRDQISSILKRVEEEHEVTRLTLQEHTAALEELQGTLSGYQTTSETSTELMRHLRGRLDDVDANQVAQANRMQLLTDLVDELVSKVDAGEAKEAELQAAGGGGVVTPAELDRYFDMLNKSLDKRVSAVYQRLEEQTGKRATSRPKSRAGGGGRRAASRASSRMSNSSRDGSGREASSPAGSDGMAEMADLKVALLTKRIEDLEKRLTEQAHAQAQVQAHIGRAQPHTPPGSGSGSGSRARSRSRGGAGSAGSKKRVEMSEGELSGPREAYQRPTSALGKRPTSGGGTGRPLSGGGSGSKTRAKTSMGHRDRSSSLLSANNSVGARLKQLASQEEETQNQQEDQDQEQDQDAAVLVHIQETEEDAANENGDEVVVLVGDDEESDAALEEAEQEDRVELKPLPEGEYLSAQRDGAGEEEESGAEDSDRPKSALRLRMEELRRLSPLPERQGKEGRSRASSPGGHTRARSRSRSRSRAGSQEGPSGASVLSLSDVAGRKEYTPGGSTRTADRGLRGFSAGSRPTSGKTVHSNTSTESEEALDEWREALPEAHGELNEQALPTSDWRRVPDSEFRVRDGSAQVIHEMPRTPQQGQPVREPAMTPATPLAEGSGGEEVSEDDGRPNSSEGFLTISAAPAEGRVALPSVVKEYSRYLKELEGRLRLVESTGFGQSESASQQLAEDITLVMHSVQLLEESQGELARRLQEEVEDVKAEIRTRVQNSLENAYNVMHDQQEHITRLKEQEQEHERRLVSLQRQLDNEFTARTELAAKREFALSATDEALLALEDALRLEVQARKNNMEKWAEELETRTREAMEEVQQELQERLATKAGVDDVKSMIREAATRLAGGTTPRMTSSSSGRGMRRGSSASASGSSSGTQQQPQDAKLHVGVPSSSTETGGSATSVSVPSPEARRVSQETTTVTLLPGQESGSSSESLTTEEGSTNSRSQPHKSVFASPSPESDDELQALVRQSEEVFGAVQKPNPPPKRTLGGGGGVGGASGRVDVKQMAMDQSMARAQEQRAKRTGVKKHGGGGINAASRAWGSRKGWND